MLSTQYVSRVTLRRDKVESFARYPFSVPALREFDYLELHDKIIRNARLNPQLMLHGLFER